MFNYNYEYLYIMINKFKCLNNLLLKKLYIIYL